MWFTSIGSDTESDWSNLDNTNARRLGYVHERGTHLMAYLTPLLPCLISEIQEALDNAPISEWSWKMFVFRMQDTIRLRPDTRETKHSIWSGTGTG